MNLPDYRLDPPEEHEVECNACLGAGKVGSGRVDDPDEDPIVDCRFCEGSGKLLLGKLDYTHYCRLMKEAD